MKLQFNKILIAGCLGFCTTITTPVLAQGVPTVDLGSLAQMAQQALRDTQHYTAVLDNWKDQIETSQKQLSGMTGVRDVTSMLGNIQSLYQDFNKLNKLIRNPESLLNGGFDALDANAKSIMKQYDIGKNCKNKFPDNDLQKICEAEIVASVTLIECKQAASQQLNSIVQRLDILAKQASTSTDIKTSQDIANQISLAQASLTALQLNFDIIKTDETNFSSAVETRRKQWMMESNKKGLTFENPFQRGSNNEQW